MIRRLVSFIGTARPRPQPATAVLMPTTREDGVGQRAAGVARVERGVGLDDVLHDARRAAVAGGQRPAQAADHPGGDRAGQAQRVADGDHQLAHAQRAGVPEDGRRRESRVRARTHGEVGERVGADDVDVGLGAVG